MMSAWEPDRFRPRQYSGESGIEGHSSDDAAPLSEPLALSQLLRPQKPGPDMAYTQASSCKANRHGPSILSGHAKCILHAKISTKVASHPWSSASAGLHLKDKQRPPDIKSSAEVRPAVIKSLTVSRSLCFTAVCRGYHDLHAARRHVPADRYHCGLQKNVLFDFTVWKPFCLELLT